jgi:hypothetical protein
MQLMQLTYGRISSWQKPECLWCGRRATLEAILSDGVTTSRIRCCRSKKCKELSAIIAMAPFDKLEKVS